ncbi:VOC family protein, partial [Geminicoccus harenae]
MRLAGIHHVTAITADAPGNRRFYTGLLGMRLVKKTVNQDDVRAYHLFYADGIGAPGTDLTFFDWPVGPRVPGSHDLVRTGLRVAGSDALAWWQDRFARAGVAHGPVEERDGRAV